MRTSNRIGVRRSAPARGRAGDPPEHRAGHQAGAARIVEVEQAAHQLARRVQAGNRMAVGIDDAALGIDLEPAEREGHPAGHRVGLERRLIDGVRPVRFDSEYG